MPPSPASWRPAPCWTRPDNVTSRKEALPLPRAGAAHRSSPCRRRARVLRRRGGRRRRVGSRRGDHRRGGGRLGRRARARPRVRADGPRHRQRALQLCQHLPRPAALQRPGLCDRRRGRALSGRYPGLLPRMRPALVPGRRPSLPRLAPSRERAQRAARPRPPRRRRTGLRPHGHCRHTYSRERIWRQGRTLDRRIYLLRRRQTFAVAHGTAETRGAFRRARSRRRRRAVPGRTARARACATAYRAS